MQQTKRNIAIADLVNLISAGVAPSRDLFRDARIVFPSNVAQTPRDLCVVCRVPLVGSQRMFCAGHWDYMVVEQLETLPFTDYLWSFREWLQIYMNDMFVLTTDTNWQDDVLGHAVCEVCGRESGTDELLCSGSQIVKRHTVCDAHRSFRWEDHESRGL